jgi:hypothetical protein
MAVVPVVAVDKLEHRLQFVVVVASVAVVLAADMLVSELFVAMVVAPVVVVGMLSFELLVA